MTKSNLIYVLVFLSLSAVFLKLFVDYLDRPIKYVDLSGKCVKIETPSGVYPCQIAKDIKHADIVYVKR